MTLRDRVVEWVEYWMAAAAVPAAAFVAVEASAAGVSVVELVVAVELVVVVAAAEVSLPQQLKPARVSWPTVWHFGSPEWMPYYSN